MSKKCKKKKKIKILKESNEEFLFFGVTSNKEIMISNMYVIIVWFKSVV